MPVPIQGLGHANDGFACARTQSCSQVGPSKRTWQAHRDAAEAERRAADRSWEGRCENPQSSQQERFSTGQGRSKITGWFEECAFQPSRGAVGIPTEWTAGKCERAKGAARSHTKCIKQWTSKAGIHHRQMLQALLKLLTAWSEPTQDGGCWLRALRARAASSRCGRASGVGRLCGDALLRVLVACLARFELVSDVPPDLLGPPDPVANGTLSRSWTASKKVSPARGSGRLEAR
ncbi:hypothetical protein COCOBI_05-6660 [Coccomyxa sp. Obi]|nr:hypothetical protein COCOBI_05-6660 [Coccomyxa sp. Obi]